MKASSCSATQLYTTSSLTTVSINPFQKSFVKKRQIKWFAIDEISLFQ